MAHGRLSRLSVMAAAACAAQVSVARADRPLSPATFGRVFERHRDALVRVRPQSDRDWVTGCILGTEGEVLFLSPRIPPEPLVVITDDGIEHEAVLLAFDPILGAAVLRIRAGGGRFVPLEAGLESELAKGTWVVSLSHDPSGRSEPHAGLVEEASGARHVRVGVPGRPGSPVLSLDGRLLGVALDRGRRSTEVLPLAKLLPFLRKAVAGASRGG